jgi:hypothetical protein
LSIKSGTYIKVTLGSTSQITDTCTDSSCSTCTALSSAITILTGDCSPTPVLDQYVQLTWTSSTSYTLTGTTSGNNDCSSSSPLTISNVAANTCVDIGSSRYVVVAQGSTTTLEDCGTSVGCTSGACATAGTAAGTLTSGACHGTAVNTNVYVTFTFSSTTTYTISEYKVFPSYTVYTSTEACPTTVMSKWGEGDDTACINVGSSTQALYAKVTFGSSLTIEHCGTSTTCASGCGTASGALTSGSCSGAIVDNQYYKVT